MYRGSDPDLIRDNRKRRIFLLIFTERQYYLDACLEGEDFFALAQVKTIFGSAGAKRLNQNSHLVSDQMAICTNIPSKK